jgi:hypothetical protein
VKSKRKPSITGDVMVLPEYGVILDSSSSLIMGQTKHVTVSENPSSTIIEVQEDDTGTILFAKEG